MTAVLDPVLDYVPRLDERNNQHLVRHTIMAEARPTSQLYNRSRWWSPGAITDQGQEGACVGHGVTQEAMSSPVRVKVTYPNNEALAVYKRAKAIDEWEGVDYEGTSVRAGLLVARERKWIGGFVWAKSMAEVRAGLEEGPAVVGVTWKSGMYETTKSGMVRVTGEEVGGHCLVINGYSPMYLGVSRVYRWRNSWGAMYGKNGHGYICETDLKRILFDDGNECAFVTGRRLG